MDDSHLCKIPPELRNTIYELALYNPNGIALYATSHDGARLCVQSPAGQPLALTAVCRDIRYDTRQMFNATNTFRISSQHPMEHEDAVRTQKWQDGIIALLVSIDSVHCSTTLNINMDAGVIHVMSGRNDGEVSAAIAETLKFLLDLWVKKGAKVTLDLTLSWTDPSSPVSEAVRHLTEIKFPLSPDGLNGPNPLPALHAHWAHISREAWLRCAESQRLMYNFFIWLSRTLAQTYSVYSKFCGEKADEQRELAREKCRMANEELLIAQALEEDIRRRDEGEEAAELERDPQIGKLGLCEEDAETEVMSQMKVEQGVGLSS